MNPRTTLLAVALAFTVATPLAAQATDPLEASYTVTVGDMAAATLSEFLKLRPDFRDPTAVTYEPATHTVDVEVFASPSSGSKTDQARALLGKYWEFIQAAHIPYIARRFQVTLGPPNYRLLYYDARAEGGPALVLQYANGQYLIP